MKGNILVFDNGGSSGYGGPDGESIEVHPRLFARGRVQSHNHYQIVWDYNPANGDPLPDSIAGTGGVQRLPNDNTLITSGMTGDRVGSHP